MAGVSSAATAGTRVARGAAAGLCETDVRCFRLNRHHGRRVFYAERGSDADARIKGLVESSRERRTLKVVTSDRDLAAYVRRCGAAVVSSGEFRRRLDELAGKPDPQPSARPAAVRPAELGDWMHYFGVAPEDDE